METPYLLLLAIIVSLVLAQVNRQAASPVVSILDRWLRWFVFAFGAAQMCQDFQLISRPYWVLVVVFFILWFLGETLYNWVAISALSISPLPLFPRYVLNQSGEEWPVQPRLLRVREWLRAQGFRQTQALKAEIGGGVYLRVSVYQNPEGTIRVQVTFIPQPSGVLSVCYAVSSLTAEGGRCVADDPSIRRAGPYPQRRCVARAPGRRSLPRLLARHRARLARPKAKPSPFKTDPIADLNAAESE